MVAIATAAPLLMKKVEESYIGDEMVQRSISECVIGGKNAEGIEYRNRLIYKNGNIYIGANKEIRQKIISEIQASQEGVTQISKQAIRGLRCISTGLG